MILWIWVLSSVMVAYDAHSENGYQDSRSVSPTDTPRNPINPGSISVSPVASCGYHYLRLGQIQTCVLTPAMPVSSCVTLGQLPSFLESRFPHLQRQNITYLMGLFCGENKTIFACGCPMPDMQKELTKYELGLKVHRRGLTYTHPVEQGSWSYKWSW